MGVRSLIDTKVKFEIFDDVCKPGILECFTPLLIREKGNNSFRFLVKLIAANSPDTKPFILF